MKGEKKGIRMRNKWREREKRQDKESEWRIKRQTWRQTDVTKERVNSQRGKNGNGSEEKEKEDK